MKKKISLKVQIIVADYYKDITGSLTKSATSILKKNKIDFDIIYVPGVYEIPQLIKWNIKKNNINLFIALGCVIRGQTYHFEVISDSVGKALLDLVNNNPNTLISNGIINAYKKKQALDRSKSNNKNKGEEAANAMIRMIQCLI
jgi:6,7-dimethyl-8-ribityllumazine synthase